MGLMMRRRRPVARMATAAAVGGVAYHAGKSHQQQAQVNDQAQAAYASTQEQEQYAQPQYAPPPPQSMPPAPQSLPAGGDDSMAQLEKLAEMHGSGVLSDDEFSAAKAKLLGI